MKTYLELVASRAKRTFLPFSYKVGDYATFQDWPFDYEVPRFQEAYGELVEIQRVDKDTFYHIKLPNGRIVIFQHKDHGLGYSFRSEDCFIWGRSVYRFQ